MGQPIFRAMCRALRSELGVNDGHVWRGARKRIAREPERSAEAKTIAGCPSRLDRESSVQARRAGVQARSEPPQR